MPDIDVKAAVAAGELLYRNGANIDGISPAILAADFAKLASSNVFTADQEVNGGGFTNSLDTVLWIAGATRTAPTVASQGLWIQHRVTGNVGGVVHDGGASELRVSTISNASYLNGFEVTATITGGANTIPDLRGLTANIYAQGTPSGTVTRACVIVAQPVPALTGTIAITTLIGLFVEEQTVGATNYTIYAPLGTSVVGCATITDALATVACAKIDATNFKVVGGSLLVRNSGDSGTYWSVGSDGYPKWNDAGLQQTTVGAAGAASAPPATPTKWLKVKDSAGTVLVVAAYLAA